MKDGQRNVSVTKASAPQFSVFLLIIFIAELAVGIAGYVKHQDLETSIVRHLNSTIKEYPTNKDVQSTFDIVQTDVSLTSLVAISCGEKKKLLKFFYRISNYIENEPVPVS